MALIKFSGFNGENRAMEAKLLPDSVLTVSLNQKPGRGDLRPWNLPLSVASVQSTAKSIYRMGKGLLSDALYWLSWDSEVHAVRGPNASDTDERTYFSGDGAPKWTSIDMATGGELLDRLARFALVDSMVLATGVPSSPPSYGTSYPLVTRTLGIPAPATACTLSSSGGTSTLLEDRFYTYTYVSDLGEESAPALPSLVLTCKTDADVLISGFTPPPYIFGNTGATAYRVYRTQAGTSGSANFFKVQTMLASDGQYYSDLPEFVASATDKNSALEEAIATTTWTPPPADLQWLTGLWNGMMAGISGRAIRFCEAYVAYAWPIAYELLPTSSSPVALKTFGQTLVVLTDGNPILVSGSSPDAMDEQPIEFIQACVAPLSAVGMGHGVAWSSPDGLAYVGAGGARILTAGLLTREDWQALNPSTIQGCMYEGRYFGFYNDGAQKGFCLDPANPQGLYFFDVGVDALHLDESQDALYVLADGAIQKWDAGGQMTVTAKSKVFHQSKPVSSFACAEIVGAQSTGNPATFKLYADGVLKHTQNVAGPDPFWLPSGYYAQDYQIEVSTTSSIQGVAVAHSMQELAQV